jgi:VanZ family protein
MKNREIIRLLAVFSVIIIILSFLPVNRIKAGIKKSLGISDEIKTRIKSMMPVKVSPSDIQNVLHIPFFGILGFLWMMFFKKRGLEFKKAVVYTLAIVLVFSLLSEFLQFFLPSRDISLGDFLFDVIGCIGGIIICRLISWRIKARDA